MDIGGKDRLGERRIHLFFMSALELTIDALTDGPVPETTHPEFYSVAAVLRPSTGILSAYSACHKSETRI